ncbi:MAG: MarR family transcriptional regulator [Thermoplasmata archaeon]|nr:MAG: MarR family transcriptional regulator [Thermoplasmata archaeon]
MPFGVWKRINGGVTMPGNGRNMRILRDLRLSTKVLILYQMVREPGVGQRDLAAILEVTPQAISDYLKHMEEEGLIERDGREARPSVEGFQFLQEHLQELGDFTYQAMRDVNVINSCPAIAGEDLKGGDPVVLELEDGYIVARKGKWGPSTGVASRDTKKGEDLAVTELQGIIEFTSGSVHVIALPSALEGGTSVMDEKALKVQVEGIDPDVVAAADPVGVVAAGKLGLEVDIYFGVDRATVDAALRGLDVLVLGGRDTVNDVVDAVRAHNDRSETRIEYSMGD